MPEPGSTFGRYVIEALLGEGGMGSVYRAQDTRLHRRVALKLLRGKRADAAQHEEGSARMLREARAAAAFEHPNAVSIYDVGEIDDTPYIAMEFISGKRLRDYIGDPAVAWDTKLRWLLDAAAALAAAHEAGLVHRDVKPHNVMVRDDGRVKVLDFGIARRMTADLSEADAARLHDDLPTITTEGMVLGTPTYMPPEQLAGAPLDGRADQFGWAVMAYELLSGQRPWPQQSSVLATITAILSVPPPPLTSLAPLPVAVETAIARALAKMPEERFPSMRDLMAELEPYAALPAARTSGPPGATSAPSLPRFSSSARLRAVPPEFAPAPPSATTRALGASAPPTPPARRVRPWVAAGIAAGAVALGGGAAALGHHWGPAPAASSSTTAPAASTSAPRRPVTLLDLPMPSSNVPAALVSFRRGLQAQHDANEAAAQAAFLSAAHDDPGLGAAHLRYAVLALFDDIVEARAHFAQAQQLRSTLGAHDQSLLEAMTPLFSESPSNWASTDGKLALAAAASPDDAEMWLLLAWVRASEGKLEEAKVAQDAALALDPRYAAALGARVSTRQLLGDQAGAIEAAGECMRAVPSATSCLQSRMWAYNDLGRCDDFDQDAHRILAIDPDSTDGYVCVAEASMALGKPPDVAWEALRTGWKHAPAQEVALDRASDRAWMAAATGDLRGLDQAMAEWRGVVAERDDEWSHYSEATARVRELDELGALDRAAQAADDFLRRRDGWVKDPGLDFWTAANDGVPAMLEMLARAGRITHEEHVRRRAQWIDLWRPRLTPRDAGYLWIFAYADVVNTPAEAAEALEAQASYGPIPPFHPMHMAEAQIGRTYLLAGRLDEALSSLERMSHWCRVSEDPFVWVHAALWLGQARQAKGDPAGACAAYTQVVQRWSGFGPRSLTLREARRNMKALGCDR